MQTVQDFLNSIYREYRMFGFRGGRIVRGRLRAMTDDCLAHVKVRLRSLGWLHSFEDIDGADYLNCTILDAPRRPRILFHAGLFAATAITTLIAGGDLAYVNFYDQILPRVATGLVNAGLSLVSAHPEFPPTFWLAEAGEGFAMLLQVMRTGIPFSVAILTILGCHEMGHYLMARRYGMNVTLPFFIPVPLGIGTLGAVIKIKSPLVHRRAVLDVGAAGPLVGAVVSVIFLTIGLLSSHIASIGLRENTLVFGESLFTKGMIWLIHGRLPAGTDVFLHPFALAGFLGLLITAINLLPIGQLDGGHVAYALLGRSQLRLASMAFSVLVTLGVLGLLAPWLSVPLPGFGPWLLCAIFIRSFMKPGHPPALDETVRLNPARKIIAVICMILLVLCFVPSPIAG